jgi:putative DNA primase/helicase
LSDTDKSVALALLLTPLARPAVDRLPLFLVSAPVRGSGKSTLVRLAATLATGRPAPVIAATSSGDELEKRLVASLLAGDGLILLDNFNGTLRSDLLSQAVTEGVLRIRPLGTSEQTEIVSDAMWVANGNGLTIGGDLSRRALRCILDPRLERPELRHFLGDPVREAQANRSKMVGAALTIMRAFIMAGNPGAENLPPWAGFERWSELVRGALVWLGLPDPLESAEGLQADDPDREILAELLASWVSTLGTSETTARELLAYTTDTSTRLREVVSEIVGDAHGGGSVRLGRWLTANSNRVVDGLRLEKAGTSGGSIRWRVSSIEHA